MDAKAKVVRWGPPQGTVSMQCEDGAFVLYDDHEAALAEMQRQRTFYYDVAVRCGELRQALLTGLEALAGEMREEMETFKGGIEGSWYRWRYDTFAVMEERIRTLINSQGPELRDAIRLTPFSRAEFLSAYIPSDNQVEQARRTILRSFQGFGSAAACGESSGFRANSNRSGTTPAHDWANYADHVDGLIERLRGVVIECRDAMAVMVHQDSLQTLHYVDPPYVHSTRSLKVRHTDNRKSYKHELSDEQHIALADGLKRLEGMIVLSGYPSPLYDELYGQWHRIDRAAHADGARDRTECLWLNDAASAGASQQRLIA